MKSRPASMHRRPAAAGGAPGLARLRQRAVAWYRREKRDLPWRQSHDPYRIWISEIMLQQTRVDVVVPYWERFLARFPDVATLARAPLDDVLKAWSGLGYYRRAHSLHSAAEIIDRRFAGVFPSDPTAIASLPGVGPYTAGAIRSIAFGQPVPVLDGNVLRVLARVRGLDGDLERAPGKRDLWRLAAAWARCRTPGDANQALMELGATVCTPAQPACTRCPLEAACVARCTGRTNEIPRPRRRSPSARVALAAALVRRRGRLLLVRRRSGTLLRDWWELPACSGEEGLHPVPRLGAALRARLGLVCDGWRAVGYVEHAILQHRIAAQVLESAGARGTLRTRPCRAKPGTVLASLDVASLEARWVRPAELDALPLATLARKALRAAAAADPDWRTFLEGGRPAARQRSADSSAVRASVPGSRYLTSTGA